MDTNTNRYILAVSNRVRANGPIVQDRVEVCVERERTNLAP